MDTQNTQFQEVLNELYVALMKVMRLANPNGVTDEMKLQQIIASLSALSGSSCSSTATVPIVANGNTTEQVAISSQPKESIASVEIRETKYAQGPELREADNLYGFRNKDLDSEDNEQLCFKILIINDDNALFEMKTDDAVMNNINNDSTLTPKEVIDLTGTPANGMKVHNTGRGILEKNGKFWMVKTPCKVELSKD